MDKETYLKTRVDDQINWMDGKSSWNQKIYKRLKIAEIVAAALVPMLAGYQTQTTDTRSTLGIIIGALGIIIVILSSIRQLNKYQENWITYRTTAESLKREKFLFETGAMPYNDDLAFQKFVINTESLLSKENESWKAVWSKQENVIVAPVPENKGGGANAKPAEEKPDEETNVETVKDIPVAEEPITDEPVVDTAGDETITGDEREASGDAPVADEQNK
ncbi:hypothetical protein BH10BAC2_BH10BAC2_07220 [soil metagenome]